jgi:hypothetical protein
MLGERSWLQGARAFLKADGLPSIAVQSEQLLERVLSMEIVRVTESVSRRAIAGTLFDRALWGPRRPPKSAEPQLTS